MSTLSGVGLAVAPNVYHGSVRQAFGSSLHGPFPRRSFSGFWHPCSPCFLWFSVIFPGMSRGVLLTCPRGAVTREHRPPREHVQQGAPAPVARPRRQGRLVLHARVSHHCTGVNPQSEGAPAEGGERPQRGLRGASLRAEGVSTVRGWSGKLRGGSTPGRVAGLSSTLNTRTRTCAYNIRGEREDHPR